MNYSLDIPTQVEEEIKSFKKSNPVAYKKVKTLKQYRHETSTKSNPIITNLILLHGVFFFFIAQVSCGVVVSL
jgi:hypothetical protein